MRRLVAPGRRTTQSAPVWRRDRMIERQVAATEADGPIAAAPLPAVALVPAATAALERTGGQPAPGAVRAARLDLQDGGGWVV